MGFPDQQKSWPVPFNIAVVTKHMADFARGISVTHHMHTLVSDLCV